MTASEINLLKMEQSLAYERAAGVIESHCVPSYRESLQTWYDLKTAELELDDEVAYLESRGLLVHDELRPSLVMICDETEPLGQQAPPAPMVIDKAGLVSVDQNEDVLIVDGVRWSKWRF